MLNNKKAQISETMTWVVATLIIIFVLSISIFVVTKIKVGGSKTIEAQTSVDVLAIKSLFSYLQTKEGESTIYEQLKEDQDFNPISGKLAKDTFLDLYQKEYDEVWLGIIDKNEFTLLNPLAPSNKYFNTLDVNPKRKLSWGQAPTTSDYYQIKLKDDKDILLSLSRIG